MTGQEAAAARIEKLRNLREGYDLVAAVGFLHSIDGEDLIEEYEKLAADRAALVAERDALLAERDAQTARPALSIEAADSLLATIAKLARNAETVEDELAQAVAERDRYREALALVGTRQAFTGKDAQAMRLIARAALAVSTP